MGSSSKKVTVGYRYFMGVHMGLVHGPVDCLVRMRVADKVVWTGGSTGGAITVAQNEIFGGDGSEGGVSGTVSFANGAPTQLPNNYLLGQLGSPLPAFRGVACAVLEHAYISANNPYLKPWSFTMTRTDITTRGETQWYVGKARIAGGACGECVDMNPAHIIRECLTDTEWGMGYLAADIDDVSFQAAADTLYDERMGISILWQRENTIEDFVQDIVRHTDAALYVDRRTGKFKLKLIRDDYVAGSLITLGPSNIERIENYTRPAFGDLVNSVTVLYDDCNDGKTEAFLTGGGNDGVGTGAGDATSLDCIKWGMFLIGEFELEYILTLGDAGTIGSCMADAWEDAKGIYSSSVSAEGVRDDMIARLTDSDTGYIGCQWTGYDDETPRTAEILSIAAGIETLIHPVIEFTWNWTDGVGADFVQTFSVAPDGRAPYEYKTECVS